MSESISIFQRLFINIFRRMMIWGILLFLVLIAGRIYVASYADQVLLDKGITFQQRSQTLRTISWYSLRQGNNAAAQATLYLDLPPALHIQQVVLTELPKKHINKKQFQENLSPSELLSLFRSPIISLEELSIQLPDFPPIHNLQGELTPLFRLTNDQIEITSVDGGIRMNGELPIETEHISGMLQFRIAPPKTINNVNITITDAMLKHPLLGKPLSLPAIDVVGQWEQNKVDFQLSAGRITALLKGSIDLPKQEYDLQITSSLPLLELTTLFALPEIRQDLEITGGFNIDAQLQGPPFQWGATISEESLTVKGTLFNAQNIRNGGLSYRPINSERSRLLGPAASNWVGLHQMGWLPAAAVAAEDSQFWNHKGINIEGIQIALDAVANGEKRPPGGSSITQQLAKNIFVNNKRTLKRKLQELLYTLALERYLSKNEIIVLYLNAVEFGPGIYGVKEAANAYFLKSPQALSIVEAAFLASLLPAPNTGYQKAQQGKVNRYRVNLILQNMRDGKHLTPQEFLQAKSAPLHVIPPATDIK